MRHGSLFSGIGGFDLAATWAGWGTVFHCEKDTFCRRVLNHYWPKAKSYGDIYGFNATEYRGLVDIFSGGFPCQPFSVAGKRKGKNDDRYLFPEALRIIREAGPRWIVLENVAGLFSILEPESLSEVEHKEIELFCKDDQQQANSIVLRIQRRVIGTIIREIGAAGYLLPQLEDGTPVVLCIPACAVDAPHRRDRVWFVAHAGGLGCKAKSEAGTLAQKRQEAPGTVKQCIVRPDWAHWPAQSILCSGNDGLPRELDGISFSKWRVESTHAFGNAIVPQVALEIFKAIEAVESDLIW